MELGHDFSTLILPQKSNLVRWKSRNTVFQSVNFSGPFYGPIFSIRKLCQIAQVGTWSCLKSWNHFLVCAIWLWRRLAALSVCIVAVCGHLMQMLSHLPLRAQLVIRWAISFRFAKNPGRSQYLILLFHKNLRQGFLKNVTVFFGITCV